MIADIFLHIIHTFNLHQQNKKKKSFSIITFLILTVLFGKVNNIQ